MKVTQVGVGVSAFLTDKNNPIPQSSGTGSSCRYKFILRDAACLQDLTRLEGPTERKEPSVVCAMTSHSNRDIRVFVPQVRIAKAGKQCRGHLTPERMLSFNTGGSLR